MIRKSKSWESREARRDLLYKRSIELRTEMPNITFKKMSEILSTEFDLSPVTIQGYIRSNDQFSPHNYKHN
jgi:hypothetical protein